MVPGEGVQRQRLAASWRKNERLSRALSVHGAAHFRRVVQIAISEHGLVAGAFGSLTAVVWAWMDWSGRLPEPYQAESLFRLVAMLSWTFFSCRLVHGAGRGLQGDPDPQPESPDWGGRWHRCAPGTGADEARPQSKLIRSFSITGGRFSTWV